MKNALQHSMKNTFDLFKLAAVEQPSLVNLSYCLRNPDTWPEGFYWDYGKCERCAMGLASALWRRSIPEVNNDIGASVMARVFHMSYEGARRIFFGSYVRRKLFSRVHIPHSSITPEMVADAIDDYLADTVRTGKP
jgi:hypothetical protein